MCFHSLPTFLSGCRGDSFQLLPTLVSSAAAAEMAMCFHSLPTRASCGAQLFRDAASSLVADFLRLQ